MQNKSFSNILYAERVPADGNTYTAVGTYWGPDGRIHLAQAKEMRFYYDPNTGVKEGILLEGGTTNNINSSCNFAATTVWGSPGNEYILTPAASLIDGQVATKHTLANSGITHFRGQTIGTSSLSATNVDCCYVIVENVDATRTLIGIRDITSTKWICLVNFNWATKAVSIVNDIGTYSRGYATKLLDVGPNGGEVYQIVAIGGRVPNPANTKSLYLYPCGTALETTSAQTSAIIHAVQYEPQKMNPSSVVITANNNVTRQGDRLAIDVSHGFFSSEQGTFVLTGRKTQTGTDILNSSYYVVLDHNQNKRIIYLNGTQFSSYDGSTVSGITTVNAGSAFFETVASAYNPTNRYIVANNSTITSTTFAAGYNVATSNVSLSGSAYSGEPGIIIKDVQYYPYKLSDADLRALTTRANN